MSKYNAIKANGFDSKKEERRWNELLKMQEEGKISELRRQVKYELLPRQKFNGRIVERAVYYIADFKYEVDGKTIVEDVKPTDRSGKVSASYKRTSAWATYVMKRKLMLYQFGIKVKEV